MWGLRLLGFLTGWEFGLYTRLYRECGEDPLSETKPSRFLSMVAETLSCLV